MPHLRPVEPGEYRALYAHMVRDFPKDERPPYFVVERNLKRGAHAAHFIVDGGRDVGYAVETVAEGVPFVLINFLAVLPDARGHGYGSALLALIARRHEGRAAVVEVEDPAAAADGAERALRQRRVRFYGRAGYRVAPVARFRLFGVPMLVMIQGGRRPRSVRAMMHALYRPTLSAPHHIEQVDVEDAPT